MANYRNIIFLFLTSVVLSVNGEFEQLWLNNRTIVYHPNITLNWQNAYQSCEIKRMQLLTIRSTEELHLLLNFMKQKGIKNFVWIAGSDLFEKHVFRWMTTGDRIDVDLWAPNQPDDNEGVERCVSILQSPDFFPPGLHDVECTIKHKYFCETK